MLIAVNACEQVEEWVKIQEIRRAKKTKSNFKAKHNIESESEPMLK